MSGAGRRRGLRPDGGDDVPGRLRDLRATRIARGGDGGAQSGRPLHRRRDDRREAVRSRRARRRRLRREGLPAVGGHPSDGDRSRSRCSGRGVTDGPGSRRPGAVEPQSATVVHRTSCRGRRAARHHRRGRGLTRGGRDRRRHRPRRTRGPRRGTTRCDRLRDRLRHRDTAARRTVRRPTPAGPLSHRRRRSVR